VEALNIGAIAGLPIACGAYFWGNRLLPVALPERIAAEARGFFGAWLLAAALAQIRPTRSMWRWQLGLGGVLLAAIALLNALTTDSHPGQSLIRGSGLQAVAAFDLVALALGLLLAYGGLCAISIAMDRHHASLHGRGALTAGAAALRAALCALPPWARARRWSAPPSGWAPSDGAR
jgi:hypothetical protein